MMDLLLPEIDHVSDERVWTVWCRTMCGGGGGVVGQGRVEEEREWEKRRKGEGNT